MKAVAVIYFLLSVHKLKHQKGGGHEEGRWGGCAASCSLNLNLSDTRVAINLI